MSEPTMDTPSALTPTKPISPPLAPWQVFLLTLLTLGFYSLFWMYRAALDLSRLDSEKRYPILWFLSPLLAISFFGSIPRLLERYDAVLGEVRWASKATSYAALAFIPMMALNLSARFEVPFWALMIGFGVYATAFALLQAATNDLKANVNEEHFTRKPYRFSILHWITLLVMGALIALVVWVEIDDGMTRSAGEPVTANTLFEIPGGNMALQFDEEGWTRIADGTYSDGSASAEFAGPTDFQWLIVFDQGVDKDIDDWLLVRRADAEDPDEMALNCKEAVGTAANDIDLYAEVVCTGVDIFGDKVLQVHRLRGSNDHYWEAWGYLSAPKATFASYDSELKRLVRSLQPAPATP